MCSPLQLITVEGGCCYFDSILHHQVWSFRIVSFLLVIARSMKTWTFNCNYGNYDKQPPNLNFRQSTAAQSCEGVGLSLISELYTSVSSPLFLSHVEVCNHQQPVEPHWLMFQVPPWFPPAMFYICEHSPFVYLLFYGFIIL